MIVGAYILELEIQDNTDTARSASYLDLHLEIYSDNIQSAIMFPNWQRLQLGNLYGKNNSHNWPKLYEIINTIQYNTISFI